MAAGPVVELVWQDFQRTHAFQTLAIDVYNGTGSGPQSFVDNTGITFPFLRIGGYLVGPAYYNMQRDNYFVIDPNGIVRYQSDVDFGFNDAHVRAAIVANLRTPVGTPTWSTVKGLYR
jgi:hypothetical protein